MDATRVMTTAALGVAMATLFAPPLGALISTRPPKTEAKLTVETIAPMPTDSRAGVCAPAEAVARGAAAMPSRLAQMAE